ncbi:putative mitochondrial protein AtMg01250 [Silene latifolia]|uniref:putative mitochondrial protein AtMg01250 n=1 Tax=Silene latifolia TaxID=37657 RepID=UPI003D77C222
MVLNILEGMLNALKFPPHFTNLLMECVTSPHYSLSLNGESFGYFKGKMGLRQGDPLSPLLFSICMEYLTRIFNRMKDIDGFKHHPLCKKMNLTHLCFADDLLVFFRGDWESMVVTIRAFNTFSAASGLRMNKQKSNVYGNGMPREILEQFSLVFGLKIGSLL